MASQARGLDRLFILKREREREREWTLKQSTTVQSNIEGQKKRLERERERKQTSRKRLERQRNQQRKKERASVLIY